MFTPTRTALCIVIGALALAANEANAGCKIISGTKVCAAWITGSEICQVGVDSTQFGEATVSTAQCIVRGVGPVGEGGLLTCNDDTLTGVQTCEGAVGGSPTTASSASGNNGWAGNNPNRQGPKCNHDKFDPNKNSACVTGHPNLEGNILESPIVPLSCNNKGICTATAEVGVPDNATCSNGQDLVDFTADEFIGVVIIGTSDGPESFAQHCTRDANGHSYTCTDPTQNLDPSCEFSSD